MNFLKFAAVAAIAFVATVVPAKADLVIPVTIASTSSNCVTSAAGLSGTLDLLSGGGATLNFGNPATFGTTEPCGAVLNGSAVAFSGGSPLAGPFSFTGAICELQGAADGCNGNPLASGASKDNDPIVLTYTGGQFIISDTAAGGSFRLVLNTPEPTSASLLIAGLLLGAGGLVRRRSKVSV
jgi:hypothetical protein